MTPPKMLVVFIMKLHQTKTGEELLEGHYGICNGRGTMWFYINYDTQITQIGLDMKHAHWAQGI